MDRTFSWSGIRKEARRVRWPKRGDVMRNTGEVVLFTALFALFFIFCDFIASNLLALLGIGG
jgi:preprotein translocase SecE subunit